MHLMRWIALAAVAVPLASLAACGEDDDRAEGGAFCRQLVAANNVVDHAFDGVSSPETFEAAFERTLTSLHAVDVELAPASLRPHMQTVGRVFERARDEAEAVGFDPAAFGETGPPAFSDPALGSASDAIETYLTDTCGA
jgi:aminoglycoside phosphotransferase (APT) family kinase protein